MILWSCLILGFVVPSSFSFGYDNETTHRSINRNAAEQPEIDLILKNRLGFKDGIEQVFKNKRAWIWIEDGGEREDDTWSSDGAGVRYRKHFHDPLVLDWGSAGLSYALGTFKSALLWALDFDDAQGTVDNEYSWPAARQNFYDALTGNDPETNYADMFRALGQVMHLVSDMAVPAHVRNDWHPGYLFERLAEDMYENWARTNDRSGKVHYTALAAKSEII
jgi:hypothetical protein